VPQCQVCGPPAEGAVDQLAPPGPGEEPVACPTCGREIGPPIKAPWHFKLLVVSVVVYLGWRGWQGVEWVLGRL
jgi:hypothetical protein